MGTRFYGPYPDWHLEFFHAHMHPLAEFPALTHVHDVKAGPGSNIPEHIHETFEISYIHAGHGEWFAEGQTVRLKPGDLYIVKPGELHGGRVDPKDPYHIFVLGIDPAALPLLPGTSIVPQREDPTRKKIEMIKQRGVTVFDAPLRDVSQAVGEARVLSDDFRALDERVIPGGQGIEHIYRRILAELDNPDDGTAKARELKILMVQALIVELLVFIARRYTAHRHKIHSAAHATPPTRAEIQKLQAWLRSRISDPPSLAQMAEHAGLSPAHFAVIFKQETGLTPLEFMTAARIDEAAARLNSSRSSVTNIALDLGFSSSQYFSLVFKKQKGCTPKEWRERSK
jgi:AraC-like DNA-binding protein